MYGVDDKSLPLVRGVVDSGSRLVLKEWDELDLPHDQISHGIVVQVDHEKETLRINDSVISISNSDPESVATELSCRVLDHFIDINLFYRFGELADLFNDTERKKTFEIAKQEYISKRISQRQSAIRSSTSIASLARSRWGIEPPNISKLHAEWTQFHDYLCANLLNRNQSGPASIEEVVQRAYDVIQTRKGLKGRISLTSLKKRLLRDLKGLDLRKPLLLGIITKTPKTHLECETLKTMFELQEWKMQGKAMVFHTALSLLNSRTGHIQTRDVPTV
ncbi:MAG: hypothetical protein B7Z37_22975, partial [Verrucomicrobia bacterium 12-59-8]